VGSAARAAKKKSSPSCEVAGREFEYHWYEHPAVGRVELKRKELA